MFGMCVFLLKNLGLLQSNEIAAILYLLVLIIRIIIFFDGRLEVLGLVVILRFLVQLKIHFQGQIFTLLNVLVHLISCHHFTHFSQSRPLFTQLFQMSNAHYLLLLNWLMELPFLHLEIHTICCLVMSSKLIAIYLLLLLHTSFLYLLLLLLLGSLKRNLVQFVRH